MSSVAVEIHELFESRQSPSNILSSEKPCEQIWCLQGSQVFERDRLGPPKGEEHSKSQG